MCTVTRLARTEARQPVARETDAIGSQAFNYLRIPQLSQRRRSFDSNCSADFEPLSKTVADEIGIISLSPTVIVAEESVMVLIAEKDDILLRLKDWIVPKIFWKRKVQKAEVILKAMEAFMRQPEKRLDVTRR